MCGKSWTALIANCVRTFGKPLKWIGRGSEEHRKSADGIYWFEAQGCNDDRDLHSNTDDACGLAGAGGAVNTVAEILRCIVVALALIGVVLLETILAKALVECSTAEGVDMVIFENITGTRVE